MPAGNALGYNQNWRYRHTGGELLMMTASGEPSAYYPMDSNGLAVQNAPAQPCICAVVAPAQTAACAPLGYGGCSCENYLIFTTNSEYYYSHQLRIGYGTTVLPQVAWIPIICNCSLSSINRRRMLSALSWSWLCRLLCFWHLHMFSHSSFPAPYSTRAMLSHGGYQYASANTA